MKQKLFIRSKENNVFDMSKNLLQNLGISALLRYEDRNSMSYGVESRLPFLDYRLVEYCLNMKSELKFEKGITKKILRKSMSGIVPDAILNRNDKMGFVTPQYAWMNNNKDHYIKLAEDSLVKMPFINKEMILPILYKNNDLLWRIINAGKWITQFNISV